MYLFFEMFLLCLVEIGECAGWSDLAVQILMYTAILINTAAAAHHFYKAGVNRKKDSDSLVAYALFVTAAADFFMTLIGSAAVFLPGVILFCLVQMIYALYLGSVGKWLPIRTVLFAVCLLLLRTAGMLTTENAFGLLDICLLLVNTVLAWTQVREKTSWLFRIGITLFLCCDLSITLRTLTTGSVHDMINFLVWIFYIPSQAAITLSYIRNGSGPCE